MKDILNMIPAQRSGRNSSPPVCRVMNKAPYSHGTQIQGAYHSCVSDRLNPL